MSEILINDLVEELSEENSRLFNELLTFDLLDQLDTNYKTLCDSRDSKGSDGCLQPIKETTLSPKKRKRSRVNCKTKTREMDKDMSDSSDDTIDDNCSDISYKPEDIIEGKVDQKTKRLKTRSVVSKSMTCNETTDQMNGKNFQTKPALRNHANRYHGGMCYACVVNGCDFMTSELHYLKNHMVSHSDDRPYQCPHESCGKRFKCRDGHRKHIQTAHTNERPFVCDHKDCDKRFKSRSELMNHKTRIHGTDGIDYFQCPRKGCNYSYASQESLDTHISKHSEGQVYRCLWPGCDYTANSSSVLCAHRRNKHNDEGILRVCEWPGCEFKCHLKRIMKRHHKEHSIEPRFPCHWPGCDKRFIYRDRLEKHLRIHSGVKRFKCEVEGCGYSSFEKGNVTKHMVKHYRTTGDVDWFTCQWSGCGKRSLHL
ncbi:unnamed protein product [Oppiella nova]|uniref:C2H2-type domain-containing protein n=1 Tax=Oppiella nova TaxID=334625 RepID=A0A7R9LI22_9ACAR|nr:unnamed protein product [Oppiella nova]CAG2163736.1 unnamed protein product [Oppiella nova]